MPIVDPKTYTQMLDAARAGKFAYPAINISSSESLNAALRGFVEAKSDGIVQVSTGGGEFGSGATVKDGVLGAVALAEYAHIVAEKCPVNIALHTDHCHPEKVGTFLRPLLEVSRKRVAAGKGPLFQSHMFDGSTLPLAENMKIAKELLAECAELDIILEIEAGVVGGEEDGVSNEGVGREKLYTTPEDMLAVADALGTGDKGQYMFAATFGNVHGVYKPGNVVLKPTILRDGQAAVEKKYGKEGRFLLVFHGGSGSALEEIRETLDYGVVKMNVDTDTQYALTRAIADHMFKNYDGVLKIDGEVGVKKVYDPRAWGKAGEASMAARVALACDDLRSTGTTLLK
ncbi:MAG TPA: class II fructose-bisphosphate aldolase [Gaiellaceae bacterium]